MSQKVVLKSNNPDTVTQFQLLAQSLQVDFHVEPEQSNVIPFIAPAVEKVKSMDDAEKETILKAIECHNGNMSQSAKALGIGRATLYRKLKTYNIEVKVKIA